MYTVPIAMVLCYAVLLLTMSIKYILHSYLERKYHMQKHLSHFHLKVSEMSMNPIDFGRCNRIVFVSLRYASTEWIRIFAEGPHKKRPNMIDYVFSVF